MSLRPRPFAQVDVFTAVPFKGNALAVVIDGRGLDETQMQDFARWTQLSETTFLLPPTLPEADYRVRIFTPGGELPFAGHPTLGSAHAWLQHGGVPRTPGRIVQESAIGAVTLRQDGGRLAFAAPALVRSGPVPAAVRAQVARALRLADAQLLDVVWVDNGGPPWVAALLETAEAVLALRPDFHAMQGLDLGVVGAYPPGHALQFEVRGFVPGLSVPEDPVTGSLNAGLALWLIGSGLADPSYTAGQGRVLGRDGRIHVHSEGGVCWIGGDVVPLIDGQVRL